MPRETNRPAPEPRPAFQVEWAILAFCAWRSADLLNAWRHSPYDRLGWLAGDQPVAGLGLAFPGDAQGHDALEFQRQIEEVADRWAFLVRQLGMEVTLP